MALELTLEKVHAMVEKAIEEKGADYVYPNWGPSCHYVDRDKFTDDVERGCIVGHIFIDELKLDMNELAGLTVNEESAYQFLIHLARRGEVALPADNRKRDAILNYLSALQQSQDHGKPWGIAHEKAKDGITWKNYEMQWGLYT